MAHCLIPTSSKTWKESKHFRNPVQNLSSSTVRYVQRDKAQRSPSNGKGLLKRERLPLWKPQGGRGPTFRQKLQQMALCPRACRDTRDPYLWRCSPVQPEGGPMTRTQTPWHAPAAGDGAEGCTSCNAAQPVSEQHNGHMRTDFMRIAEISLIYACHYTKTNKT